MLNNRINGVFFLYIYIFRNVVITLICQVGLLKGIK